MKPQKIERGIIPDFLGYSSEKAFQILLRAAVGIFVARHLGPDGLGLLNYAQAIFGLLLPLSMLGMEAILVRRLTSADRWEPLVVSALAVQLPIAFLVSVLGMLIVSASRGFEREPVLVAFAVALVPILNLHVTLRAYLEAAGRVRRIIGAGITAVFVSSLLKIGAILMEAPVWFFAMAGTVEVGLIGLGLLRELGAKKVLANWRSTRTSAIGRDLLRDSWPLMFSSLAVAVYMQADMAMLGLLVGDTETGIYTAAVRLSEVWYFLPMSALPALRPRLARLFVEAEAVRYVVVLQRFMTLAFGVSITVVVAMVVFAPALVWLLYGPEFSQASGVLRIHILAAPFVFLGLAANQWLIDRQMTRAVLIRTGTGAVVNVGLNLLLIPTSGAQGAALATLASYALSGVLLNGVFRRTRSVFRMQMRSFYLAWPSADEQTSETDGQP